jgi:GNAT superfamily N-acetyltransferase
MRIETRPMDEGDVESAARLLAARHREDRVRTPVLSARYEEPAAVRPFIEQLLARPMSRGVIGLADGEPAGFMIGLVTLVPPTAWFTPFIEPRSGQVLYQAHAATGAEAAELYRHMYAAIAPRWLAHGCFAHFVEIHAGDETAMDAWFSLGFGQALTFAVRDTSPVPADPERAAGVEIHQASAEDIEVVLKLNDDLARHHNASPIFLPYLPETEAAQREHQQELLEDLENAHFIAYRDGEPVGMQTFHPPDMQEMARPEAGIYLFGGITVPGGRGGGVGTALLRHSMDWAREQGYAHCALHYFTANIPGARFWTRSGFRPLTERLIRRVDERIAWASGRE